MFFSLKKFLNKIHPSCPCNTRYTKVWVTLKIQPWCRYYSISPSILHTRAWFSQMHSSYPSKIKWIIQHSHAFSSSRFLKIPLNQFCQIWKIIFLLYPPPEEVSPPLGLQIPRSSFWGCTFFRTRNLMIVTTEYEIRFCGKYKHINWLSSKSKS